MFPDGRLNSVVQMKGRTFQNGLLGVILLCVGTTTVSAQLDQGADRKGLKLTLSFQPKEESFKVTLKNASKNTMNLLLDTREFEGKFFIFQVAGSLGTLFDKVYYQKLLTSLEWAPNLILKPNEEIEWKVRIDDLIYGGSKSVVTSEGLAGKSVWVNLDRLSILTGQENLPVKIHSNVVEIPASKPGGTAVPSMPIPSR